LSRPGCFEIDIPRILRLAVEHMANRYGVTLDQINAGKMTRKGLGLRGKKDGAPSRSLARA